MNKNELKDLVLMTFALFNQTLYAADQDITFKSWFSVLRDLQFEDCRQALETCAISDKFMPTPGALRRFVIVKKEGIPTEHQFWSYIQAGIKARNEGTTIKTRKEIAEHEIVLKTIEEIGPDVVWGLHTNGDRQWALAAYTENLKQHMAKGITVVESNAT
jgi:hypothetical protein|tara:strand:+ start:19 stop:498 length:480 start_codon:yes stop_codon:yes gene_type:complete